MGTWLRQPCQTGLSRLPSRNSVWMTCYAPTKAACQSLWCAGATTKTSNSVAFLSLLSGLAWYAKSSRRDVLLLVIRRRLIQNFIRPLHQLLQPVHVVT